MNKDMKISLTIAGSDSSGGAGMQADIKTMQTLNVFATSILTCSTAQNTFEITEIINLPPKHIKNQIETLFKDFKISSVKISVIGDKRNAKIIADLLTKYKVKNIIIDPVMVTKTKIVFIDKDIQKEIIKHLFPIASLITPNSKEAEVLSGIKIKVENDMKKAYEKIKLLGCKNVLIKGGHLDSKPCDLLFLNEKTYKFVNERIKTKNTHGTGCTLSSAIVSYLALGFDMIKSVELAKDYVYYAIKNAPEFNNKGAGPIMFHVPNKK